MQFQIKSKSHVSLEPIAFADIVINLFVFFFITFGLFATFDAKQKGLVPIELPKSNQTPAQTALQSLTVTLARTGAIHVGYQTVVLPQLKRAVDYELSRRKDKNVRIRADRTVSVQSLISVLDILRETKANSISIETEKT